MIGSLRLKRQQIAATKFRTPREIVSFMGAMQAQDYPGAKWSIGLRLPNVTDADIEKALAEKSIVRTWPMRGTLHFVAPEDVRWMLALLTPRVLAASAKRREQLNLDAKTLARSKEVLIKALSGGKQLTREETMSALEKAGISTASQRGYHILWHAAQEALICFGPPRGKEQTFVLLDEWLPKQEPLPREEALAALAKRYFTSHGPATLQDFAWWSGLTMSDVKKGVEASKASLREVTLVDQKYFLPEDVPEAKHSLSSVHLLPGFDEYLLGYKDRSAVLDPQYAQSIHPGANGVFKPTIVVDGQVSGIWERTLKKDKVIVRLKPFAPLPKTSEKALAKAVERYGSYLGLTASIEG